MANIVVLGAGLSGVLMAYELVPQLRKEDKLILIGQGPTYHFVPSNPWVAVGWRKQSDIEITLPDIMQRKKIEYIGAGAKRVHPEENRIDLEDGKTVDYDYLVIATGPDLAFDEIEGLGRKRIRSRSATSITPPRLMRRSRSSARTRGRSLSARCRARPASVRPTSSPSSSIPSCAAARSATRCR